MDLIDVFRDSRLPLCVDLDGTLLTHSSLSILLARSKLFGMRSILNHRHFSTIKHSLTTECLWSPKDFSYRGWLLNFLKYLRKQNRRIFLVTGADQKIATSVADYCGIFEDATGSNPGHNLAGSNKASFLSKKFGTHGFDYIGDSWRDFPVWQAAHCPIAVCTFYSWVFFLIQLRKKPFLILSERLISQNFTPIE